MQQTGKAMAASSKPKRTHTNDELFILALYVVSLINVVVVILPFPQEVKGVVAIFDVVLSPIFLADFLYRLISAPSKRDI